MPDCRPGRGSDLTDIPFGQVLPALQDGAESPQLAGADVTRCRGDQRGLCGRQLLQRGAHVPQPPSLLRNLAVVVRLHSSKASLVPRRMGNL